MNHDADYDRDNDREDILDNQALKTFLEDSIRTERDLMENYLNTSERINNNTELKERLQNLSEGNVKRLRQLEDDLRAL